MIQVFCESWNDPETYLMEGEWDDDLFESLFKEGVDPSKSYLIRDTFYPRVEATLSDPAKDKQFRKIVESYLDRNSTILHEPGPIGLLRFLDSDKKAIFNLFGIEEAEVKKVVKDVTKLINESSQFQLANKNPVFVVLWCVIRYYTIKKDEKGINTALAIYACAAYPSILDKYFQYGTNKGVMLYTIDNLTNKFTFKIAKHTFGALMMSINASYKFLGPFFIDGSDKECIRWLQRIRNDQNSMIKKLANEYHKNYEKGLSVYTSNETFDDNNFVDNVTNNTAVVEEYAQKVCISMITNGIDWRLSETAAKWSQVGVVDAKYYLTQIITKDNEEFLNRFIEAVLFIYLYDTKHRPEEIHSKTFLSFGIELFRRTNSGDPNVKTIKDCLEKWAQESGIYTKFKREASRINYKKSIYWYIVLCIQKFA